MTKYWNQLKPNERMVISIGGIVLTLLSMYLLLLEPFTQKSDEYAIKVNSQRAQIDFLKETALEIKALRKATGVPTTGRKSGQSLLVVVDQTAKKNKLADSLKRVEPDGSDRVRVWMDNAAFDDVAKWLNLLNSNYQLDVESAVFDKLETVGLVNVRLVIVEGGT